MGEHITVQAHFEPDDPDYVIVNYNGECVGAFYLGTDLFSEIASQWPDQTVIIEFDTTED